MMSREIYTPSEEEVETAFIDYVNANGYKVIGRQIHLHFGILDVLFYCKRYKHVYIAEVKKRIVNGAAYAQLFGYVNQLNIVIAGKLYDMISDWTVHPPKCSGVLVGSGMDYSVMRLMKTYSIEFCPYSVSDRKIDFDWQISTLTDAEVLKIYDPYCHELNYAAEIAIEGFFMERAREIRESTIELTNPKPQNDILLKSNSYKFFDITGDEIHKWMPY